MTESLETRSDATDTDTDTDAPGPGSGQTTGGQPGESRERRGPPPNPLYHPLFLPILLTLFSLWFGWDGFITSDPEMLEHRTFNQVMFFLILPICAVVVPRGIKEFHEEQNGGNGRAARR